VAGWKIPDEHWENVANMAGNVGFSSINIGLSNEIWLWKICDNHGKLWKTPPPKTEVLHGL